jgi:ribosomal protein S12 methylthiotransferase accessory factor
MMEISFPGGVAVDATFRGFTVSTDQPEGSGGANSAPSPFELFLASLGTCAGFYALRFCQQRQIATEGMQLTLDTLRDPQTKHLDQVQIVLQLPAGFPEKYRDTILRAIDQCAVKKAIFDPPQISVETR